MGSSPFRTFQTKPRALCIAKTSTATPTPKPFYPLGPDKDPGYVPSKELPGTIRDRLFFVQPSTEPI